MKVVIFVLACLAVANAATWFHGHDDGQWHGEGLVESQDWASHHHGLHHAAIVTPHAAIVGPSAHAVVAHHGIGHAGLIAHGYHGGWTGHHYW